MGNYIDLHMHSNYSDDGEFTPIELVRKCKQASIRIMAISDHNCAKANAEAQKEAERLGIRYIPAIEIDCVYRNVNLHLLGYQIDYKSPDFEELEEGIRRQGVKASYERLRLTRQMGLDLTEDELNTISDNGYWKNFWTGEIFAEVLLGKPEYQYNELLRPYREGGARCDNPYVNFYWDYYAQGKLCYAEMIFPSLQEAISIIKRNGGKAMLAHPGNNLKNQYILFDEMIALGIDGVEVFSSYHNSSSVNYFYQKAREHSLLITCGSDYHGKTKPSIVLGGCSSVFDLYEIERQFIPS